MNTEMSEILKDKESISQIIECAEFSIWGWNISSNEFFFDKKWCQQLGLDYESVPHHISYWESVIHPEDLSGVYCEINSYLNGHTSIYKSIYRVKHQSGSWVWVLDRGQFRVSGGVKDKNYFMGVRFDISEQKQLELYLSEAQRNAGMGCWYYNQKTQSYLWTNPMYELFPEKQQDGPPSLEHHIATIFEQDRRLWLDHFNRGLETGLPYYVRYRTLKNGNMIWIEERGVPELDLDGAVVSISGTCKNITQKIKMEEAFEDEKIKTIHAAKLAAVGEMASGIAHEVGNALAIISGALPALRRYKSEEEMFDKKIQAIERAVVRISKITNGLRKFSRKTGEESRSSFALESVIEEVLLITDAKRKKFSTQIKTNINSDAKIFCDQIEIEQVLVNLINNAIDASAATLNNTVEIQVLEQDSFVIVRVLDSGGGISKELEEKIFQPFFTTKPVGVGTGLGLSISKSILEDHGASLSINRNFSNTCFEIQFKKYIEVSKAS